MFASCRIASFIRRQTATPASSPTAASSFARLTPSSGAISPYHLIIRQAARQMSISVITEGRLDETCWQTFTLDAEPARGTPGRRIHE